MVIEMNGAFYLPERFATEPVEDGSFRLPTYSEWFHATFTEYADGYFERPIIIEIFRPDKPHGKEYFGTVRFHVHPGE